MSHDYKVIVDGIPVMNPPESSIPLEIAFLVNHRSGSGVYLWREKDRWVPRDPANNNLHLRALGLGTKRGEELMSPAEKAILFVQTKNRVDYAAPIAGRINGSYEWGSNSVLVTTGCQPVVPKAGDWSTLRKWFVELLLGEEQFLHHMGWWHQSRKNVLRKSDDALPGQVPIYVGPAGSGKSLLQGVTTSLIGGRSANPFLYMVGKSDFNANLFQADHLVIEDQVYDSAGKARNQFAARIKELSVNHVHSMHGKGTDAVNNIRPKWRVSMSANNEQVYRSVLPVIDDSLQDKIMLFRTGTEAAIPVDLKEPGGWEKWSCIMRDEMPALAHAVDEFEIPERMQDRRFGVAAYHDPTLVSEEREDSDEVALLGVIQHDLPEVIATPMWEGKALDLERILTGPHMASIVKTRQLLGWQKACGTYLGRLAKSYPEIVKKRMSRGHAMWTVDMVKLKDF